MVGLLRATSRPRAGGSDSQGTRLEALLVEAELTHTYFLAQILFGLSGIFPKSLLLPQGPHSNRSLERMFLFLLASPKADNCKRNEGEGDRIGGWGMLVWD